MKKLLIFPLVLLLAAPAFAQTPQDRYEFFKKEAQSLDKKLLSALSQTLDFWVARNYELPAADDALLLKASIDLQLRSYAEAAITLLRHRYEYPASPNAARAKELMASAEDSVERGKRAQLNMLYASGVDANLPVDSRLAAFLTDATQLELAGSFAPLFTQYQLFFGRFGEHEDRDKLELLLGDLYRQDKNYLAAIMQYRKVVEIHSSSVYNAAAHRMMGDVYGGDLKDYDRALEQYKIVLQDYPASTERAVVYKHLAILSENRKDYSHAVNYAQTAAELFAADGRAQQAYDALLYKADLQATRLKDYAAAADTLDKTAASFIHDGQKFVEAKLKAADIYDRRLKDIYSQAAAYEAIAKEYPLAPQAPQALYDAARLHEKAQDPARAKELYQTLIVEHPANALATRAQRAITALEKQEAKTTVD